MKKLLTFILISLVIVSCYDDYILDNVFNSVYFPYQNNVRTYVVGEGTVIEVGAALGGVMENKVTRNVSFELNPVCPLEKGCSFLSICNCDPNK